MKKIISLLLILLGIYSMCACGNSESPEEQEETGCSHYWREATCTEAKICNFCGESSGKALGHQKVKATCTEAEKCTRCDLTFGVALGHTTDSGKCDRCGENSSAWELGEYTDEFNMPTGNKYVATELISGTFSNSATTNSDLWAILQVDRNNIGIMLWEYQRNLVKGTFDYEDYDITILDDNGRKHYYTGTIYKANTRIYFDDSDRSAILNLLKTNDTLKFYIKSTKYSISSYLFTVDTKGFSELYKKI